ncbi:MAG: MOSC domain-containing protein [Burkholderiaceae bacterium]
MTQRELPQMALVRPSLIAGGLLLQAPGMADLALLEDSPGAVCTVTVWSDHVRAIDAGEAAARWFSQALGGLGPQVPGPLRLVRFDPSQRRACSPKWTGGREAFTAFADGFGVLVTGTASLEELNGRLRRRGHPPVAMVRFRPNVVLGGMESHDEDRIGPWRVRTDVGEAVLDNVKPCARCPIPNIDPLTALSSPEVGDTLQTYRQDRRLGGAITFGMNAIAVRGSAKC